MNARSFSYDAGSCRVSAAAVLMVTVSLALVSPADAEINRMPNPRLAHRLLIELGADAALAVGNISESGSDWQASSPAQGAVGFSTHLGWQFSEHLSVGGFAAYQWAPNDSEEGDSTGSTHPYAERVLWMATEGRWMPWSNRFYLKGDLGAVRYSQEYNPYHEDRPGAAVSQWAPAIGLGVAWVFFQQNRFTAAVDFRTWLTPFGSDPPMFTSDKTAKDLGRLTWYSIGLQFGFRP